MPRHPEERRPFLGTTGLGPFSLLVLASTAVAGQAPRWTVHLVNDSCPGYAWVPDEEETRRGMAEVVRVHLDAMARTDGEPEASRDRYTMTVTSEALAFLERYPARRDELVRRLREGRVTLSPFLANSLWGGQSDEGFLRTLYAARRLERQWGVPIDVAHHAEVPSLPWGAATLLAGAGVRWLSIAFLDKDTQWDGLDVPPVFVLEGPDGGRVFVVLDAWASRPGSTRGRALLDEPQSIASDWLPRFEALGAHYPFRDILVLGSHGDPGPECAGDGDRFASAIRTWNEREDAKARLVSSTLSGFCRALEEGGATGLLTVRGDFGHSWEAWPVSLAAHAATARQGEREILAAESLAVLAGGPELSAATRDARERAEWSWAMLGGHAWNGKDAAGRRQNASLRKAWAGALIDSARAVAALAWEKAGFVDRSDAVTLFNPSGFARQDVVRLALPPDSRPKREALDGEGRAVPSQYVLEDEGRAVLYFTPPPIAAWGTAILSLVPGGPPPPSTVRATPTTLEGPFYRLTVDPRTGGLASLVHKPTRRELVVPGPRNLAQTVYFDGREAAVTDFESDVETVGPVLGRLHVSYRTGPAQTELFVTLYAAADRVDLEFRVAKKPSPREERLVHVFPVVAPAAVVRLDTTGAVVRPRPLPEGDLVDGANTKRFAVQGFVDASSAAGGVTVAPVDAFLLRTDLEALSFEALGSDQNFEEVSRDQGGATEFLFRYALRAHAGDYDGAEAFAWSRSVATPIEVRRGRVARPPAPGPAVDPARAIATALKAPDDPSSPGLVLRVRETAGRTGPLSIAVTRWRRAFRLDLLEREMGEVKIAAGTLQLDLAPHGFAAVRLE